MSLDGFALYREERLTLQEFPLSKGGGGVATAVA